MTAVKIPFLITLAKDTCVASADSMSGLPKEGRESCTHTHSQGDPGRFKKSVCWHVIHSHAHFTVFRLSQFLRPTKHALSPRVHNTVLVVSLFLTLCCYSLLFHFNVRCFHPNLYSFNGIASLVFSFHFNVLFVPFLVNHWEKVFDSPTSMRLHFLSSFCALTRLPS